jgi:hypothetical protein
MMLPGASCDTSSVVISTANGQTSLVNNSSKAITAYVLVNTQQRAADGMPRTFTGNFSRDNALAPGTSFLISAASETGITIDFLRFDDGSSCDNSKANQQKAGN